MLIANRKIRGFLIDLDGVLYVGSQTISGAQDFVQGVKDLPHLYLTNTTTQCLRTLAASLRRIGLDITPDEIMTTPLAAKSYLVRQGRIRCKLVLNDDARQDFTGIEQAERNVDAVVIGDIGDQWQYALLNDVFELLMGGAELVALHRNKFWLTSRGLQLDIGAFVAGLEYCTGREATIIGKPNAEFYRAALEQLGLSASEVVMIGDDIESDVRGAQALGMAGILVRTGKFREAQLEKSQIRPDLIVDSIACLSLKQG